MVKEKTFVSTDLSMCEEYVSDFLKTTRGIQFISKSVPVFEDNRYKINVKYDELQKGYIEF